MAAVDFDDFEEAPVRHLGAQTSEGLHIHFYMKQIRDQQASIEAGRPIHKPTEMVKIHILGDKTNVIDRPVEPFDKQRFAKQYKAFKEDKQEEIKGQPLKDWPTLPENLAEDWAAVGIKTVEQLSEVPDHVLTRLGPLASEYKRKALKYLEAASQEAPIHFMQDQMDKQNKVIEALQKQIAEMKGEAPVPLPPQGAVPMTEAAAETMPKPQGPIIRKKA